MTLTRRKFLALAGLTGVGLKILQDKSLASTLSVIDPTERSFAATSASTPPLLQFIAVGDVGTGESPQYDVAQSMIRYRHQHPFPFVLLAGDNIYDGGEIRKISRVFEQPYHGLLQQDVKFHAVLGNHDIQSNQGEDQIRYPGFNMQGRYYTFTHDPVQFFALDTNPGPHWSDQLEWLDIALAQSHSPWKIVIGHHSIYASGLHSIKQQIVTKFGPVLGRKTEVYPSRMDQLTPLFTQHNVQLYINGHEHHYERTHAIAATTYLTCGMGAKLRPTGSSSWTAFASSQLGFAAIEVFENELVIQGIGVDGHPFDRGVVALQASSSKLL